jgi:uncharacterized protein HemX
MGNPLLSLPLLIVVVIQNSLYLGQQQQQKQQQKKSKQVASQSPQCQAHVHHMQSIHAVVDV